MSPTGTTPLHTSASHGALLGTRGNASGWQDYCTARGRLQPFKTRRRMGNFLSGVFLGTPTFGSSLARAPFFFFFITGRRGQSLPALFFCLSFAMRSPFLLAFLNKQPSTIPTVGKKWNRMEKKKHLFVFPHIFSTNGNWLWDNSYIAWQKYQLGSTCT